MPSAQSQLKDQEDKKKNKEEEMITLTAAVRTEALGAYMSRHIRAPKRHLLSELPEKMERFVWYTCVP